MTSILPLTFSLDTTAISVKDIGLVQDVDQLNAFVAAAGVREPLCCIKAGVLII